MAITQSRHVVVLDAITAILNADTDIGGAARSWHRRKKPYNRGTTVWSAGGYVCPAARRFPPFNNQQDELIYGCDVFAIDPSDGDLVQGMVLHTGTVERVEDIFRQQAHGNAPATLRSAIAALTGALAMAFQFTEVVPLVNYDGPAFSKNYDVSGCTVLVHCSANRRSVSAL